MKVELIFKCEYCGEELGTRRDGNAIYHDDFHDCFGESVGFVADVGSRDIVTASDILIEIAE